MENNIENSVDIWSKIGEVDKRYIWWTVSILIAVILIRPVGLPFTISQPVFDFNDILQSVPEGGVILMEFSITSYGWDEVGPGAIATAKELLKNGYKLITVGCQAVDSAVLSQLTLDSSGYTETTSYGEDYVNLGFITGGEISVFTLSQDFQFVEKDIYGTPLSELPLTKDIKDANDIDLVIDIHSTASTVLHYVRHWVTAYKTKLLVVGTGAVTMSIVPYYESGDILGYLQGSRGCAEFELKSGFLGDSIKSLDAQSVIQFSLIALIILANLSVLAERRKK